MKLFRIPWKGAREPVRYLLFKLSQEEFDRLREQTRKANGGEDIIAYPVYVSPKLELWPIPPDGTEIKFGSGDGLPGSDSVWARLR